MFNVSFFNNMLKKIISYKQHISRLFDKISVQNLFELFEKKKPCSVNSLSRVSVILCD
jgi:hypothetical protein